MVNTTFTATQITPPRVPIVDERTGLVSREWYRYFYSLYAFAGSGTGILPIGSGGTGLDTIPTDGQLLIGDTASSAYKLHVIDTGSGIGITNGSGTILITNTGVLSNIAGSGIGVSSATGNVTISNSGVLSVIAGSGISVSSATGNVTIGNTGVLSFSGGSTGLLPSSATAGAISLSGTLGVGYGGTGQTTYTNGQLLIGNTTGNTLTKTTLTAGSGVSISNGAGSITISATGSGGTVTAVTGTAPVVSSGGTTPAISMPKATTSVDGYLSSTDWTTFNNKGSGTVTSVTATSPVASTGGTTPVISMPAATTSVSGYLTNTDWNTFNSKQPAGTYVTAVTGTAPVASSGGTTPAISMAAASASANGYLTSTDWSTFNGKGSGTVTSVSGTGTVNGISLSGTVTTTGSLTLGGTLSGVSLTTQVSGTLPVANGGTGVTTSTGSTNVVLSSLPSFNTTIGVGASASASGSGVTFPATHSASSDVNTLDDYEEGAWTPDLRFGGANTGITYQAYNEPGFYYKIGGIVFFSCTQYLSSKGSATGNATVAGLPFTSAKGNGGRVPLSINLGGVTYVGSFFAQTDYNSTQMVLAQVTELGVGAALTDANFSNTSTFFIAGFYTTI